MMQFLYTTAKLSKFGRDLRCGSIVAGGDLDTHNDVADDKEVLVGVGGSGDDVLETNFFVCLFKSFDFYEIYNGGLFVIHTASNW